MDDAASWFTRAIEQAQIYDNVTHAANVRAHLGRVALAGGDLERAEQLLTAAYEAIPAGSALHLRIQIELWMATLYLAHNERAEALRYLTMAQEKLVDSPRHALQVQAEAIAADVG